MLLPLSSDALWPTPSVGAATAATAIDSAADFVGTVFVAPETGTITNLHFRVAAVTSAQPLTGGIYTVDAATGGPGTLVGTAGTLASPTAYTIHSLTGLSAAVTKGTRYCIKINFSATAGNLNITSVGISRAYVAQALLPYRVISTDNAGTLIKATNGVVLPCSVEYSGGVFHYIQGVAPASNTNATAVNSSGVVAAGMRFQVPVQMTVSGLWCGATFTNLSAFTLDLYDDSTAAGGTPLASSTGNENILASNSNGTASFVFDEGTNVVLEPGVWYRAVLRSTNTVNITFYRLVDIVSSAHLFQLFGTDKCLGTQYTGGAWVDTDADAYSVGLVISAIHDASGIGAASMNFGI